jgi:hypothetical protein
MHKLVVFQLVQKAAIGSWRARSTASPRDGRLRTGGFGFEPLELLELLEPGDVPGCPRLKISSIVEHFLELELLDLLFIEFPILSHSRHIDVHPFLRSENQVVLLGCS